MVIPLQKKLRIGWFSFSCCEDSTIIFTELLNDHYKEWLPLLDIRHARVLQSHNVLDELDVAFIEGALASADQEEKVKEIRAKSTKVVAIGACAATGMPSAQRNTFNDAQKDAIEPILCRFSYGKTVKKLSDVIPVDHVVPGCPMIEEKFIETLTSLLKEFSVIHEEQSADGK